MPPRPRPISFWFSGLAHGCILVWVAFGPAPAPREARRSLYEELIQPHENRIIWYHLNDKMPDISPSIASRPVAPRASVKAAYTAVSGPRDEPGTAQRIWVPEPEATVPKPVPLPNVLAMAPPKLRRQFTPPPAQKPVTAAAALPDAPVAALPDPRPIRAVPRTWTPPAPPSRAVAVASLADAPVASVPSPTAALPDLGPSRTLHRPWTPPAAPGRNAGAPSLPDAPPAEIPQTAMMAIVGLNPSPVKEFEPPKADRSAGFSAGAEIQEGSEGSGGGMLVVPGLLTRGVPKDQPTLVAGVLPVPRRAAVAGSAMRSVIPTPPAADSRALRLSAAPDPRLEGRTVYSIAIQMPNVTSYYGSWMVWFAESPSGLAEGGAVHPPAPVRKVDPKYIAAAASERVEGVVRLFGVIRRNGRVESIAVIRRLDDRLDQSAAEALAKWQFEPATRNGAPVEVDAVFEIPFRLAPRSAK